MYKDKLLPGTMYHIYNRGNSYDTIFKEHKNYQFFLHLWRRHVSPIAESYVYSLLPSHFHFLIKTLEMENEVEPEKKIQQGFSNLFNSYSKSINKAIGAPGAYSRNVLEGR